MLSFELSPSNCVNRIETLQSPFSRQLARFLTACMIGIFALAFCGVQAETTPLSRQMARSVMQNWPDGHYSTDPSEYDHFTGGKEMVRWLIEQLPAPLPIPVKSAAHKK